MKTNPFEITAYYNGILCIIDGEHTYRTGEVLTELIGRDTGKIEEKCRTLKRLLDLLLFNQDGNYNAWEYYDTNVHEVQRILNGIKGMLYDLPIYRYTLKDEELDYDDLTHVLMRHRDLFDSSLDMGGDREVITNKELLRRAGVPEDDIIDTLDEEYDEEYHERDDDEALERLEEIYAGRRIANNQYYIIDDHMEGDYDMHNFVPYWHDGDYSIDEINGIELLNNDLHALIDPYISFLELLISMKQTYGVFLEKYIHTKGRFLNDEEIAEAFDKYTKARDTKSLRPRGTMQFEYKTIERDGKLLWCDMCTFDSLGEYLYYDFFRGLRSGYIPKKCEHCGQYFLLASGRYYEFCERPIDSLGAKTCRNVGAHKKYEEKCKSDPIWLAYNRAYKAHYARMMKKKMTKSEFLTWSDWAIEFRNAAIAGKVGIDEYEARIKE